MKARICYLLLLVIFSFKISASELPSQVLIIEIKSEIDVRTARYIEQALKEGEKDQYRLILIEMNTYGGTLQDADKIRIKLLEFKKPVYVFINKNAASAGALISLACDSIYMAPGANIGSATVVDGSGTPAPAKYQSYMKSLMRSTAESNGRDPKIAERMVENENNDTTFSGKTVLAFTTSEAIKNGYCEGQYNSTDALLSALNIDDPVQRYELSGVDKVILFFMNPFISGLLILLIIGGIYFELQTPGIGFPLFAAIVATVLYFVPYYLNGLAQNWEILLFFVGLLLIAFEIFVIPGFGIVGIAGIIVTFGSLILVMINNDAFDFTPVKQSDLMGSIITTLLSFLFSMVLIVFGGIQLTKTRAFRRIALQDVQDSKQGYSTASFLESGLIGKEGIAYTVLRPSGKIRIGDNLYDAFTRGEFIEKDTPIKVLLEEGAMLTVSKIES